MAQGGVHDWHCRPIQVLLDGEITGASEEPATFFSFVKCTFILDFFFFCYIHT